MKSAIKLIIVVVIAALIAFVVFAYLGINSPLPFADVGQNIYSMLSSRITTSVSTVTGLVGTTGVGLAGTAALGYAYNQVKKQKAALTQWANNTIQEKETTITAKNEELKSVTQLKDEAFTKLSTEKAEIESKFNDMQTSYTALEQSASKTSQDLANATKTIESQISGVIPANKVFTSADGLSKIITVEKKVIL